MGRQREPLTDKHYAAIEMITAKRCETYEDIAAKLGVSRRQLYRWRQRPDFKRELQRAINAEVNRRMRNLRIRIRYNDAETLEFIMRNTGLLTLN